MTMMHGPPLSVLISMGGKHETETASKINLMCVFIQNEGFYSHKVTSLNPELTYGCMTPLLPSSRDPRLMICQRIDCRGNCGKCLDHRDDICIFVHCSIMTSTDQCCGCCFLGE